MSERLEVKLTTQTFEGAGGREMFPDLQMGDIVLGKSSVPRLQEAIRNLNEDLVCRANAMGYTHVFGVEYRVETSDTIVRNQDCGHLAIGTGYKPRE